MFSTGFTSVYSVCSDAAGVAGNLFAFVLFVSPIPTFRRILRNQSTEQFSGLPYIYALLNCLICLWYGTPLVSPGIILVATVNSIGAVFQLIYVSIFISYAENAKKLKMSGFLIAVFALFGIIVFVSLKFFYTDERRAFVGYLSVASLISMFASPLFVIQLVIKSRSVEYMPFYLSLSTFLMSLSFFVYGMLKDDPFISLPNGIGTLLGIVQLMLYAHYSSKSGESSRQPLLDSYA
ncbi:bidirectional sugar transporter SWEET2a-like [Mangifera indica]|uniref:bidirectional sugar transporter SWEET2a-like n=1 Tax=Mangifera indica TaxID=29780 RepID=UPI001CFA844B|nr:bidirectional sugar transporter SWEET2a-like [Mangifera indica]